MRSGRSTRASVWVIPPFPSSAAVAELDESASSRLSCWRSLARIAPSALEGGSRYLGGRLSACTVGVVRTGRVGSRVIAHLLGGFPGVRVLGNDIATPALVDDARVSWVSEEEIYETADIISFHLPLKMRRKHLVGSAEFARTLLRAPRPIVPAAFQTPTQ